MLPFPENLPHSHDIQGNGICDLIARWAVAYLAEGRPPQVGILWVMIPLVAKMVTPWFL